MVRASYTCVSIDEFCDAIHQEFYSSLIYNIIENSDGQIDEEALRHELNEELRLKLCIDEETVSLNALELFTREPDGPGGSGKGLEKAIGRLLDEIA